MSERFPGGFITKSPVAPTVSSASGVWTLDQQQQYQQAGTWPYPPVYIEDVFSTWLYQGTSANQTITNGVDLSTKGGLVWCKGRPNAGYSHRLFDTVRGVNNSLSTNLSDAQATQSNSVTSFNTTGFSIGTDANGEVNFSGSTYVSWTFRKQPKFFDIVTYTGNGATGRNISHNLGSVPGCIIVRRYDTIAGWDVYHQSLGATKAINLHATGAAFTDTIWNSTSPTSTVFTVNGSANTSGGTYVAYIFAHNAGGFGSTTTDNVISCGSFTTDASGNATVSLGYEPQYVMLKCSSAIEGWIIEDTMRGANYTATAGLFANTSGAEFSNTPIAIPTATGFVCQNGQLQASKTYIYIAIRRGPMKVPTSGTSVFSTSTRTGNASTTAVISTTITSDLLISCARDAGAAAGGNIGWNGTRMTGGNLLRTNATDAETGQYLNWGASQTGWSALFTSTPINYSPTPEIDWNFRRSPSFLDVVCYTGTGAARTVTHNLGVAPELMIVKSRSLGTESWTVWNTTIAASNAANFLWLNSTSSVITNSVRFNSTAPTSSVFTVGSDTSTNGSGSTYVAYLFASCPGVSKVGSYTGNGSSQTINCSFTGGARFVLIKRTDSTGDWYVWDTARGIVTANDPHLSLNTSAAEVTTDDSIDTDNTGFIVNQLAATNINVTSATYIFLAIA